MVDLDIVEPAAAAAGTAAVAAAAAEAQRAGQRRAGQKVGQTGPQPGLKAGSNWMQTGRPAGGWGGLETHVLCPWPACTRHAGHTTTS